MFILLAELWALATLVLVFHNLRGRFGLTPLLILLASVMALVYAQTPIGLYWMMGDITIAHDSVTAVPAIFLGLLMIYVFDGTAPARVAVLSIVAAAVIVSAFIFAQEQLATRPGWSTFAGLSPTSPVLRPPVRVLVTSTATFALSLTLASVAYQTFANRIRGVGPWVAVALGLLVALIADGLLFALLNRGWGIEVVHSAVTKLGAGLALAPAVWFYVGPRRRRREVYSLPRMDLDILMGTYGRQARALRQQVGLTRRLLDTTLDGFILADHRGVIVDVNDAYAKMVGYTIGELRGMNVRHMEAKLSGDQVGERIGEFVTAGASRFETVHRKRNGETVDLDVSLSVISSDSGPLILAFVRDVGERNRVREELRALARRLDEIREQERVDLARELHDELAQSLTVLRIDAKRVPDGGDPDVRLRLDEMLAIIDDTQEKVRGLASQLRPPVLDDLGLEAAIEWHAGEFAKHTGIECVTNVQHGSDRLDANRATAMYRIMQEALTNVARHSGAARVEIRLAVDELDCLLEVKDNGTGIRPERVRRPDSLGIVGMRERAAAVGGEMNVRPGPSGGTVVWVRVPRR